MAFPASAPLLSDELAKALNEARRIRNLSTAIKAASLAGPVARFELVAYMAQLNRAVGIWNAARSTPNIADYAQQQLGNGALDVAAEFTAMLNATTALRDWVFNNFPKDSGAGGSGAWLVYSYDSAGVQTSLTFATAELAQFRTNVDALLATIS